MATSTKKAPKFKFLTDKEFGEIKTLLAYKGMTTPLAVKLTGRSQPTISYIKRSDDYEAYKNILREVESRKATKPVATTPQPQPEDDLRVLLQNISNQYAEISEKLDLVAVPKRRFFN